MNKLAVFTSGGDSPGMNACIRAVVRTAISNGIEAFGVMDGYSGILNNDFHPLGSRSVSNIIQRGGTILRAGRCPEFHEKKARTIAARNLIKNGIGGLVAIGGDGTFRGADELFLEHKIPIMGIPATIDNDVSGTDCIGFDTAVNTATSLIDKIKDTSISHGLPFFVEVMGRHCGEIALMSALASGAEAALLPEVLHDMKDVCGMIRESRKNGKKSIIIVVAEGDESGGAEKAGRIAKKSTGIDYRVCVLGHTQRGGSPTVRDRILATRLGSRSVEELMKGTGGMVVGELNGKPSLIKFEDAHGSRKEVSVEDLELLKLMSI